MWKTIIQDEKARRKYYARRRQVYHGKLTLSYLIRSFDLKFSSLARHKAEVEFAKIETKITLA